MSRARVFFVTGGSRGLGAAVVRAALREGYDVAFTFVHAEEQAAAVVAEAAAAAPARSCKAYHLDVRDPREVEAVGDRVLADFGTVDVVVCNGGVNRSALIATMSDAEWHDVIDTNLTGSFFVARQFLPTFLAEGRGRFVFVSSVAAGGLSGGASYAASKAGLVGLSGTLAKEYGRKGITSNVVSPGYFQTDMTRETMPEGQKDLWLRLCPLGRMGEPDELTATVLFLASERASFVNGQCLSVTGGLDWAR